jgi:hypothetical protein
MLRPNSLVALVRCNAWCGLLLLATGCAGPTLQADLSVAEQALRQTGCAVDVTGEIAAPIIQVIDAPAASIVVAIDALGHIICTAPATGIAAIPGTPLKQP